MSFVKIKERTWIFLLFTALCGIILTYSCQQQKDTTLHSNQPVDTSFENDTKGALLATSFNSFEALKAAIRIEYFSEEGLFKNPFVRLTHESHGTKIVSELEVGTSEDDIKNARDGSLWDKVQLVFNAPFFIRNRKDFLGVYILARRDFSTYGEGDLAFYHLAETMLYNINEADLARVSAKDLTEKGYINTFNHIVAQAFMTTLYSEEVADFVADAHERSNMPELISGVFTEEQLFDLETGPVDNYVDMMNNEWGQELGKQLKRKFRISRNTIWTPELLANYLNEIQAYFSWAFGIGFEPFKPQDEKVVNFAFKINDVMK